MTLDSYQLWMVKQNPDHAKREGLPVVLARLRANGYHAVAAKVEEIALQRAGRIEFPDS